MRLSCVKWPHVALLALCAGTWPVWRWYVLRLTDGSDEPWGLLALGTLALLLWRRGAPAGNARHDRELVSPAICIAAYAAAFLLVPPLVRAVLAGGGARCAALPRLGQRGLVGIARAVAAGDCDAADSTSAIRCGCSPRKRPS
jgi:hypothetical protein